MKYDINHVIQLFNSLEPDELLVHSEDCVAARFGDLWYLAHRREVVTPAGRGNRHWCLATEISQGLTGITAHTTYVLHGILASHSSVSGRR